MLGLLLCLITSFSLHAPLLTLRSYAVYLPRRPPATTFRLYPLELGPAAYGPLHTTRPHLLLKAHQP